MLAELRWNLRTSPGRRQAVEDREFFVERCAVWMARELAAANTWLAWVATTGTRSKSVGSGSTHASENPIVGQIWAGVVPKVPNPSAERERHVYLSNLFVLPEYRGGVGSRLIDVVIEWAGSHGADRIILWPTERSTSLYERHGFTRDGPVMERPCRPER